MRIETVRGVFPGGSWSFSSWRPLHLAGLVDHIWAYSGPTSHRRKRVLPNGRVELLINFAAPYRILDCRGADHCRIAWLGGPQVGPVIIEQPAQQDVMGVRLLPAGAYGLLSRPMRDVTGLSVDLADLIGPAAGELAERCDAAGSVASRFRIVAAWVAGRLAQGRGMDEAIAWAVGRLDATGGAASIGELRAHVGMSKARLAGRFREQVGLTPKLYARVVRFHQTLGILQSGGPGRLTDVALDGQFYDQPHMNAEFRALGGLTPSEFLAARHPVGDGSTANDGPPAG